MLCSKVGGHVGLSCVHRWSKTDKAVSSKVDKNKNTSRLLYSQALKFERTNLFTENPLPIPQTYFTIPDESIVGQHTHINDIHSILNVSNSYTSGRL